jgi:hypothetical protein
MLSVVEYVHKHANVERTIQKRQGVSVKRATFDLAFWPHQKFDALNGNVRTKLGDEATNRAVATADIQNRCILRNLRRKHFCQDARAPFKDESAMPTSHPGKWPGDRTGCLGRASHLFQVVVANECLAADAQHAEEERCENNL